MGDNVSFSLEKRKYITSRCGPPRSGLPAGYGELVIGRSLLFARLLNMLAWDIAGRYVRVILSQLFRVHIMTMFGLEDFVNSVR